MNVNDLRYLVALAQERHFSRAAERCHVAQPTMSIAIRKLEEELGAPLFERGRGEIRPTPFGEAIVAQARVVLNEYEALRQLARSRMDPLQGPLRLGAIYTIGPYLLPKLIPVLRDRAPAMPLLIEEDYTSVLHERLDRGDLDVVILSLPFAADGILTRPLYREPFVVALPRSHPWSEQTAVEPQALAETDLLLLGPGHCFRDQVLEVCPRCARSADTGAMSRTLAGGSLETIRHMVASGAGVTVLPRSAATGFGPETGLLELKPFSGPQPQRTVALAWRQGFGRQAVVELLAELIPQHLPAGAEPVLASDER